MRKTLFAFVLASLTMIGGARADSPSRTPGELRVSMRQLWDDQLVFTRNFIISTLAMSDDQIPVTEYFLAHQNAIATALEPYYGPEASQRVAQLLQAHGLVTVELIRTISEGNSRATSVELSRMHAYWVASAQELAAYLATLNPQWNRAALARSLETYLDLTMAQVAGRSMRNFEVELAAYERVQAHTTRFADTLSNGIIKQYPGKFR